MLEHHIDRKIWTKAVPNSVAYAFPNYRIGDRILGHSLKVPVLDDFRAHKDKVAFGKIDGIGVVVLGPKAAALKLEGRGARAAAAHEAFHLLVQYLSLRPRFDMLGEPPALTPKDANVANQFFTELNRKLSDGGSVCPVLAGIAALDDGIKHYIFYKSYIEWPAEWYMRWSALRGVSFNDYFAMRVRWGGGEANMLYVTGVKAIDQVDARLGRGEWQAKYMAGDHPLNLLAEAYGCPLPIGTSFQVEGWHLEDIFPAN